jgi:uncharacterized membrane protein HdeD (DUF308 family)
MTTIIYKTYKNAVTNWWLLLVAGLTLLGLGIWVLASPLQSYLALSVILAFGIFSTGLFEIIFSIVNHKNMTSWGWTLLGGLLDLFVGGYLFLYPLITMAILPLVIGFWVLFRGVFAIGHSIDMRSNSFWEWGWLLLSGIFIVFFALMIIGNPAFGIMNIIFWTGLAFICAGIFRIYLSLKLRKLKNDL